MVRLTCPKCRFVMRMPEHTLGVRPICPVCSGCALEMTERDQDRLSGGWRRKKVRPVVGVRPGVVRNLILGVFLLLGGPALLVWASTWPSRAGYVKAVFIGHGLVLTMWGIILLVLAALRKGD
jgi:hypothetical protein